MSRSTIMRIIAALCTVMLLVSSCAIASAEYAHSIVIDMPSGKMAYGPSIGYQKRPADTTSKVWHCYLDSIVYSDCECEYPYVRNGLSVYVYCRNNIKNYVASKQYELAEVGGYSGDEFPFYDGIPLENKLAEYKIVAVRNNCLSSEDAILLCFSWQPY